MSPRITTEAGLRELYPAPPGLIDRKQLTALDTHCERWVRRAPLVFVATAAADGTCDVSPRGDAPGFVRILDDRTLAIPDRKGNNRLDALRNLVQNPRIGLVFVIPGIEDTLRVNGRAAIVDDDDLLASMAVGRRAPITALVVEIEEAYLHCGRAFKRGRVWDPQAFADRTEVPTLGQALRDQTAPGAEESALLAASEKDDLW